MPTGLSPTLVGLPRPFGFALHPLVYALQPPFFNGFGLFRVRSPLLAESFLFLRVLRCFSSPGSLSQDYFVHPGVTGVLPAGFPHSDITGSQPAHGSPMLFAVYHVLRRLLTPRHPPFAFFRLFLIAFLQRHAETALRPLWALGAWH